MVPQRLALGKGAGFRQFRFKHGSGMPIAAVARRRESRLDPLNRQSRHLRVAAPFREQHHGDTLIAGALGPFQRHAFAGQFQ
jgi:hypothetical protein